MYSIELRRSTAPVERTGSSEVKFWVLQTNSSRDRSLHTAVAASQYSQATVAQFSNVFLGP